MRATLVSFILGMLFCSDAQSLEWNTNEKGIGLLAGLAQPIAVDGGNLQLEATAGRFVFDYSHGWSLDLPAVGDVKDQELTLHLPYSTGFGVGYQLTETLDLRFEPKLHNFEVRYDEGSSAGTEIDSYRTITLGFGAYYKWHPFAGSEGAARGLTIAPSFRVWPNVWSSLDDDRFVYQSEITGQQEVHEASNIGFGNTPFIFNVSVGYVFSL